MDKILSNEVVEDILGVKLALTDDVQNCSFITPEGKFLKIREHYEIYRFLVMEDLVPCIPDAELLLSQFGWVRYSYVGYLTLPFKKLTKEQYKALEIVLTLIKKYRDEVSIQLQDNPRFYQNYSLDDIPYIIDRIKLYYTNGQLLP